MRPTLTACLAISVVLAPAARGQDLARRAANVTNGHVRLSFTGKPDVCHDFAGRGDRYTDEYWESFLDCAEPIVHVQMSKRDGSVIRLRVHVGGRWRTSDGVTDLGRVPAAEAASYFLAITRSDPVSHRAIHPAALADSSRIWPELVELASDHAVAQRVNREAMQWLGILARELFEDDAGQDVMHEARRRALFSISQLPKDDGIPRLIDVSESHRFEYMRALALFWLGQSGEPRVIPVMERIFRSRG